ncbi:hypothetical protein GGTG_10032 [Gaeumannomyces tritici R3-111a-1]|uniref:Uncharacterized protein n=1 Tax=Gaeumannomyces tritici (strain R3-111a-1) TaxID=644352 RepID=J3P948_GAET3|nr:hypothetical protein GGTG_10032 [Gaeumannomyces tritici R3-111a-1]EJT73183.1 hypothetical protein GGTG_10032 [Gaeumannomyces tritici R3-111a-1]
MSEGGSFPEWCAPAFSNERGGAGSRPGVGGGEGVTPADWGRKEHWTWQVRDRARESAPEAGPIERAQARQRKHL